MRTEEVFDVILETFLSRTSDKLIGNPQYLPQNPAETHPASRKTPNKRIILFISTDWVRLLSPTKTGEQEMIERK